MAISRIVRLTKALSYLNVNETISLGEDTFLTGLLDGSDKFYGFINLDGNLHVEERKGIYPIGDMTKEDLTYIFGNSAPNIFQKLLNQEYEVEIDSIA